MIGQLPRGFLLALLLSFVLPLAQVAAAAHEVSHVHASLQDKSAPGAAHCDLCVVAAAVTGGGAASQPLVIAQGSRVVEQPSWVALVPVTSERVAAFRSRAPPFAR